MKHPNVVQITDFGRLPDSVPYFVMELLVGHTLGELLKAGGPLVPARGARILRKVAGALAAAHAAGVVHRDLKPDNVFMVEGDELLAKVLDFGTAKALLGPDLALTRTGAMMGTPAYASPEQIMGAEIDTRSDLWS